MVEGRVVVGGDVGGRVVVVVEEAVVVEIDIFTVDSGFFDTSLKILTPAPHVVHVTNIRYANLLLITTNLLLTSFDSLLSITNSSSGSHDHEL